MKVREDFDPKNIEDLNSAHTNIKGSYSCDND